ncbi:hypothetical protein WJX73_001857 [Symbiochloris irregularis]|uniref:Uncharacterized protein n=1 Tax=Symbiochloris irregularis TaxID=706552 RepID=A0AAW1PC43_9CHLO
MSRAELCCAAWHRLLITPQARGLWGQIEIRLNTLPLRLARDSALTGLPSSKLFLPTCRWLQRHMHVLTSLTLVTASCSMKTHERKGHCCHEHGVVENALAMLLASLLDTSVELHIMLNHSEQDAWLTVRLPIMDQILVRNLLTLHLQEDIDDRQLASFCALTRLTSLELYLYDSPAEMQQAATGISSLRNLHKLSLCEPHLPASGLQQGASHLLLG